MPSLMSFALFSLAVLLLGASADLQNPVRFCTTSDLENVKCLALKINFTEKGLAPGIDCVRGIDKYDCMQLIEDGAADVWSAWAVQLYTAGKNHGLVPFAQVKSSTEPGFLPAYTIVAVVKKSDTSIKSLEDLRGRNACLPALYSLGGWMIPMGVLVSKGLIKSGDCVNNVANMAAFFNSSCAAEANNRAWGSHPSLCALCVGEGDAYCTLKDPYSGYEGALRCLTQGNGDVAFTLQNTLADMVRSDQQFASQKDNVELLCTDGSRKRLDSYAECNWGTIPDDALVTSPKKTVEERADMLALLQKAARDPESFRLFDSKGFGGRPGGTLLFREGTRSLESVGDRNDYQKYLGDYMVTPNNQYPCEATPKRWCTTSLAEQRKCMAWRDAILLRLLRPEIECVQAADTTACLRLIQDGSADAITLDGGDIYRAGKDFGLQVLANEHTAQGSAKYWAVAVVSKHDPNITFTHLKGHKSCHTGIGRTAGWNVPVGTLLSSGQLVRPADCNIAKAVGQFFVESCAPGALSPEFDPSGQNPPSLCALCAGKGSDKCSRTDREPFYGYTGAFRCMATRAGDVAFVKHSTPLDNTDGGNSEPWAKDLRRDDFELLCKDGTRANLANYRNCNLARVPSHAVVSRSTLSAPDVDALLFLLRSSDYFYGPNAFFPDFLLFSSKAGGKDLLFSDTTTSVEPLPVSERPYRNYLGDFADSFSQLAPDQCKHR